MTDERILVCIPTAWGEPDVPSIERECLDCGQPVWASARVMNDVAVRRGRALCMECFAKIEGPVEVETHPIAVDEFRQWLLGQGARRRPNGTRRPSSME